MEKKLTIMEKIKRQKQAQIDSIVGSEKSMHDESIDAMDLNKLSSGRKNKQMPFSPQRTPNMGDGKTFNETA